MPEDEDPKRLEAGAPPEVAPKRLEAGVEPDAKKFEAEEDEPKSGEAPNGEDEADDAAPDPKPKAGAELGLEPKPKAGAEEEEVAKPKDGAAAVEAELGLEKPNE